jgi:hypothetical protein
LGTKNFTEEEMATDLSLDRCIGRVTIKTLNSLNAQFKMRHKTTDTLSIVSKTVHYHISTIKILARRHVSTELTYLYSTARRYIHINGSIQTVNLSTAAQT